MPANRRNGPDPWSQRGDFLPKTFHEMAPDPRTFDIDSPEDVKTCLLESDPTIASYQWSLSDKQLEEMALESATTIVTNRQQLLKQRQSERTLNLDEVGKAREKRLGTVVVSTVQDVASGVIHNIASRVEQTKSFG